MTGKKKERMSLLARLRMLPSNPLAVYSIVALTILAPMLLPGYIFALDMAFTPHLRLPEQVTSSYPFYALLHALGMVVPSQIIQKAMLFLILVISGYGMHMLLRRLQGAHEPYARQYEIGAYFGGLLYMANPFTYSRFMVGQFAVLLGYALLPFFVRGLFKLSALPGMRTALLLGGLLTLIGIVSIHTVGLAIVLVILALPAIWYRYRHNSAHFKEIGKYGIIAFGLAALLSSYWLIPLIAGKNITAQAINGFTASDQGAFETLGSGILSKTANVLQLQGFWADGYDLYKMPQDQLMWWSVIVLLIWLAVAMGACAMYRQQRRFSLFVLAGSACVAIILACTGLGPWLAGHVPMAAGYREPQKFVALVVLAFAVLGGYGVGALTARYKAQRDSTALGIATISALTLPILLTPTMFWGFSGQLTPRNYPPDWTAINRTLNEDDSAARALFLPWHQYMSFNFTGRIVVNPAAQFFDKETITSNDLEFHGASPTVPDAEKATIGRYLHEAKGDAGNLGRQLAEHNIRYVLLAKEHDYATHRYLDMQQDFIIIQDTTSLTLYRNEAYGRTHHE